ncbi:MAG: type I-U CRISPR-associated RAMP protein Csb1/Cas7u [Gemmataceae bacterium]|jgi:CRISPR-associated protein Csb1|nr:type I-U CRISPR-associated RAMP protein Csb1/Cas7u [Gemmataceae bacterium]
MPEIDLTKLNSVPRLLFTVELKTLQGDRFQPTGFPSLGAATYQTKEGEKLLVESAQSMANRLEATCWDAATNKPVAALDGISHVTVNRGGKFLTDSMLEAHRINSPYLLCSSDRAFLDAFLQDMRSGLGQRLVDENEGFISRNEFAKVILKYDVGSLIHGVFFASNKVKLQPSAKPSSIAGGRLRLGRSLSAFIEASNVRVAASGGVKNDQVHPEKVSGELSELIGNVPFTRDEYVAERIDLYINLDLAQIRGYGLGEKVERLLILLALYRVRKLLEGDLRLRTACDLEPVDRINIVATRPEGFKLPSLSELESAVKKAITECKNLMVQTTVTFEDDLKKAKEENKKKNNQDEDTDDEDSDAEE